MALDKPYQDVPGTIIFDADQSRRGYGLNQYCTSLMKAENRDRFKANERAYLDEGPMTEEQKQAVLARALTPALSLQGEGAKRGNHPLTSSGQYSRIGLSTSSFFCSAAVGAIWGM